jgi:hypothetical protein
MASKIKRNKRISWKIERASVHKRGTSRPQSNKYRPLPADSTSRPEAGTVTRYWRGGYKRKDGTYVQGHYVTNSHHKG